MTTGLVESWITVLDRLRVSHEAAPSFVPVDVPSLLVVGYGAKNGTIVFFVASDIDEYGPQSIAQGYGFAVGFELTDTAALAEVLDEWGAVAK
jgi:hypothetical protein